MIIKSLQQTAAAMLVSQSSLSLSAAAAAELQRSASGGGSIGNARLRFLLLAGGVLLFSGLRMSADKKPKEKSAEELAQPFVYTMSFVFLRRT